MGREPATKSHLPKGLDEDLYQIQQIGRRGRPPSLTQTRERMTTTGVFDPMRVEERQRIDRKERQAGWVDWVQ